MSQTRRLALTTGLFAIAVALVVLAATLHSYGPLFGAWIPLVGAAWILSRHDPGYVPPPPARGSAGDQERPIRSEDQALPPLDETATGP